MDSQAIWRPGQGESCVHLHGLTWLPGTLPTWLQPPPMAFMSVRANATLWILKSEMPAEEPPTNRRRLGKSISSQLPLALVKCELA